MKKISALEMKNCPWKLSLSWEKTFLQVNLASFFPYAMIVLDTFVGKANSVQSYYESYSHLTLWLDHKSSAEYFFKKLKKIVYTFDLYDI